jgi:hypothetical protein
VAAPIMRDRTEAVIREEELRASQLSEFSDHPWQRTTAGPESQSL